MFISDEVESDFGDASIDKKGSARVIIYEWKKD
jgi:hypothetical protein